MLRRRSGIGLDLGHHTIKAVQVERAGEAWRLDAAAETPTPEDAIRDGVVVDTPAVGAAIREMLRAAGLSSKGTHIAVAGAAVNVRRITMPQMPESTLRRAVRAEAGRYVAGSIDETMIDFEPIGPTPDGQLGVLLVASPSDIVRTRLEACTMAGLEVDGVDIESFAAYRSLIEADRRVDPMVGAFALVDIGAVSTTVSVINRGVFAMNRAIPNGGANLTEAIKTYFKLGLEEAEAGKSQLNVAELLEDVPTENPPLRVVQPHLDEIIREIRRSLNYFQSQEANDEGPIRIERLFLLGGGAKLRGVADYFRARLDLEVHTCSIKDNPRFTFNHDIGDGLTYAVATGLAMRIHAKGGN